MAVVSPPSGVSYVFKIAPDGALIPATSEIGPAGASSLGNGVLCLVGSDLNRQLGEMISLIYANVGFPLPWARYTVTWNAVLDAISTGKKVVCDTF